MRTIDKLLLACTDNNSKPFRRLCRHAKVSYKTGWLAYASREGRELLRSEHVKVKGKLVRVALPTYKGWVRKAILESQWKKPVDARTCPHTTTDCGFGLAGGGYGPYEFCTRCGSILEKTQELD